MIISPAFGVCGLDLINPAVSEPVDSEILSLAPAYDNQYYN